MTSQREQGDPAEFAAALPISAQGSWASRKARAQGNPGCYTRPPAGLHKYHRQNRHEKGMHGGDRSRWEESEKEYKQMYYTELS